MHQGSGGFHLKTKGTERNEEGLDRGGCTSAGVWWLSLQTKGTERNEGVWIEGDAPRLWWLSLENQRDRKERRGSGSRGIYQGSGGFHLKTKGTVRNEGGLYRGVYQGSGGFHLKTKGTYRNEGV